MPSLLRTPVADVLLHDPPGELPDVAAAGDLVAAFHVLHREERVVLAAHVVEAEVHRRAVGGGRQHGLGHDAWDVQLLPHFPKLTFRIVSDSILMWRF